MKLKKGQKLLGTDGQVYEIRNLIEGIQGYLITLGQDTVIYFNPSTLEIYGLPKKKIFLIPDSGIKAKKLWDKKERLIQKAFKLRVE